MKHIMEQGIIWINDKLIEGGKGTVLFCCVILIDTRGTIGDPENDIIDRRSDRVGVMWG